jgi:farnesyl diphosphate synthase
MISLQPYQDRIHAALLAQLPPAHESPMHLHQAMHYAVFNGGKRLRPLFVYATGNTLKADPNKLDILACAVEFIHTYSLIHDDLPAMDDDDYRRGKPSCHKAFDEATAILAGDALQTLAFASLARIPKVVLTDTQKLRAIDMLTLATGSRGMAGGQALDLAATAQPLTLEAIENLYRMKTGALISSSIMMGVIAADIGQKSTLAISLQQYANCMSLAFQIQDDILDIEGDIDTLGKAPGSDSRHAKPTYPAVAGLETAKKKVATLKREALDILHSLPMPTDFLRQMTDTILKT